MGRYRKFLLSFAAVLSTALCACGINLLSGKDEVQNEVVNEPQTSSIISTDEMINNNPTSMVESSTYGSLLLKWTCGTGVSSINIKYATSYWGDADTTAGTIYEGNTYSGYFTTYSNGVGGSEYVFILLTVQYKSGYGYDYWEKVDGAYPSNTSSSFNFSGGCSYDRYIHLKLHAKQTKTTGTVSASISGTAQYGSTLSVSASTNSNGSKSYQWWYSTSSTATSGTNISGATNSSYAIGSGLVGKYIGCTVSVAGTSSYTACSCSAKTSSTVAKANGSVTAPTAKQNLVYSGQAQALINAGSSSTGTIKYKAANSNQTSYGTGIPTAINAGTYTVYYYVQGDANHNDVSEQSIQVTISKASGSISYATSSVNKTYGDAVFTNALTNTGDGAVTYSSNNTSVATVNSSTGEVTIIGVGSATITATVTDGTNYTYATKTATYSLSVSKASNPITVTSPQQWNATFNTSSQTHDLTQASNAEGNVSYEITSQDGSYFTISNNTLTMAGNTPVGSYSITVTATASGNDNYNSSSKTITVNIEVSKATASVSATINGNAKYNSTLNVNVSTASNGTKTYQWWYADSSSAVSGTNISDATSSTYTVGTGLIGKYIGCTVSVAEATSYNASSGYAITTSTVAKAEGSVTTAPTAISNLVYSGQAQALINNDAVGTGTMMYSLSENTGFTTSIPTGINAGDYIVYYYAAESDNYTQSAVSSVNVSINKADGSVTAPTAISGLVFNGNNQALINAGSSLTGTIQYKAENSTQTEYGTEIPSASNAGIYTVFYKVIGNSNYNDVAEASIQVVIAKAAGSISSAPTAIENLVYNNTAQTLIAAGNSATGTMMYALAEDGEYSANLPQGTNAGDYTVYYYAAESANYSQTAKSTVSVSISKATGSVSTLPTAITNLVFTGNAQTLINAGSGTGTMMYSLSENSGFSTTLPQGTNAGDYTVYYYAAESDNYNQSATANIFVNISKAQGSFSVLPQAISNLQFNNTAQTLITAGQTSTGTIFYSLNNNQNYSEDLPQGTNAGNYTIYYKIVGNSNYFDVTENTLQASIAYVSGDYTTIPSANSLTYTGQAQDLINAGDAGEFRTVYYSLNNELNWLTNIPQGTDAGEYTVYFKADSTNPSVQNIASASIKVTIAKAQSEFTTLPTVASNLIYTNSPLTLITAGTSSHGEVQYSLNDTEHFSTNLPQASNVGTYNVYYKIVGDTNHLDKMCASPITASITKTQGVIQSNPTAIQDLVYTGLSQTLVSAGSGTGTMMYSLSENTGFTTSLPTAVNAGTYTVYFYVTESDNYSQSETSHISATIAKASGSVTTAPSAVQNLVYDAQPHNLVNSGVGTGTMYYSLNNTNWSTEIPQGTNAGDYTVYYYAYESDNFESTNVESVNVTIAKASGSVSTIPSAINGLVYSEQPQTLINNNAVGTGTIMYALTQNGEYSETLPQGTNAGDYTVYYYAAESANYNQSATQNITATIAKASGSVTTAPTPVSDLVFTTNSQTLVIAGSGTGTMMYSLSENADYSEYLPMGLDAGSYTVYYYAAESENYNQSQTASLTVIISKAVGNVSQAPSAMNDLTYNGQPQNLIFVGSGTGTFMYSLSENGEYATSLPQGTNAGDYTVYYYVAESENYTQSEVASLNVTISKASGIVEISPSEVSNLVYSGQPQTLISAGTGTGTMMYSLQESSGFTTTLPQGTNASQYTVYYYALESENYTQSSVSSVYVTIAKAEGCVTTLPTAISNLVYTGETQALISAGSGTGTMMYSLTANAGFSANLPTGIDVGNYIVYYYVEGDSNHFDTEVYSILSTIQSFICTYVAPTAKALVYTGESQTLVNAGSSENGVVKYSLTENGNYSTSIPTGLNAGQYKVYYYVQANQGYKDSEVNFVTVKIAKAEGKIEVAPCAVNLTYTGNAQKLLFAGESSTGTMYYSLSSVSGFSTVIPTATQVGKYRVYYYSKGDANHNDTSKLSTYVYIDERTTPADATLVDANLTVKGNVHAKITFYIVDALGNTFKKELDHTTNSFSVDYKTYITSLNFYAGDTQVVIKVVADEGWTFKNVTLNSGALPSNISDSSRRWCSGLFLTGDCNITYNFESAQSITINYNANGGEGFVAPQTVDINSSIKLKENTFTREGYTFVNWKVNKQEIYYKEGQLLTQNTLENIYLNNNATLTLYAKWKANSDLQNGYVTISSSENLELEKSKITTRIITASHGGALSVESSNPSVVSVQLNVRTLTIQALGLGTATITVTCDSTNAYKTASVSFDVKVINKMLNVKAVGYSGVVDGFAHGIKVVCDNQNAQILYGLSLDNISSITSPTYITEVGKHKVYYKVSLQDYESVIGCAVVEIMANTINNSTFTNGWKVEQYVRVGTGDYVLSNEAAKVILTYANNFASALVNLNDQTKSSFTTTNPGIQNWNQNTIYLMYKLLNENYSFDSVQWIANNETSVTECKNMINGYDDGAMFAELKNYTFEEAQQTFGLYKFYFTIPARINITFDANGGLGTMQHQYLTIASGAEINENQFTKPGYLFLGWTVGSSETMLDNKQQISSFGLNKIVQDFGYEITLHAQWKKIADVSTSASVVSVNPTESLVGGVDLKSELNQNQNKQFNIKLDSNNSMISFNGEAVSQLANLDTNNVVVSFNTDNLIYFSGAQAVLEFKINDAGFVFDDTAKATISYKFDKQTPNGKTLKVYYVDGDYKEDMDATYENGTVSFDTLHFSTFVFEFVDLPDVDDPADENTSGVWVIVGIVGFIALTTVVVLVSVSAMRKRKF